MFTTNKSILFITTASLAANPRLVKELSFLKSFFSCSVLCFEHDDWSAALSKQIILEHPEVTFNTIDRKKEWVFTLLSKLLHKTAILVNPILKNSALVAAYASNDKTPQLLWKARQLCRQTKFDTVIAHNLGAFFPAMLVAQIMDAKLQLDIEDFYPGEALYFNYRYEEGNRHRLMQAAFLMASSITYASTGIANICQKLYQIPKGVQQVTIINSFSDADFQKPSQAVGDRIKSVWFSQHIGPNRGLEQVFEAAKVHQEMDFHLIGNLNQKYLDQFDIVENIHFYPIMPQADLHAFLGQMDIGLALEPGKDENNKLALSNKILAYAQAGLYILATPTDGQTQFLNSLSYCAGELIPVDLVSSLNNLDKDKLNLASKQVRWEQAKEFSWEQEQKKLFKILE